MVRRCLGGGCTRPVSGAASGPAAPDGGCTLPVPGAASGPASGVEPAFASCVVDRLRKRLRLTVILIRDEDAFEDDRPEEHQPACPGGRLDPAIPVEARPSRLLPSVLSAGLTLFQTREAHMHASEAILEAEAQALWTELEPPGPQPGPATPQPHCLTAWKPAEPRAAWSFQLMRDASLYPSGWVLSPEAMAGIRGQAGRAFAPVLPLKAR
jgi:hypothetical protein